MKALNKPSCLILIANIALAGCSTHDHLMFTDPQADIRSSFEEVSKNENDKAKIVRKLPKRIGNMELFNVADYSKKFITGPDLGYGLFYDLKNNRNGSGNIFLYKRYKKYVDEGLSNDALIELRVERRDIERTDTTDGAFSTENISDLQFYKMKFVTPPDSKNDQYDCYLFITGYNGVYLKVLFYYSMNSEYGEDETETFMNSLAMALRTAD